MVLTPGQIYLGILAWSVLVTGVTNYCAYRYLLDWRPHTEPVETGSPANH